MRRTRLWRAGVLEAEDFDADAISDRLCEPDTMVWLDLQEPSREDLACIAEEFGLEPLAVEDAVQPHQRPKLDRYTDHLFMTAYGIHIDDERNVRTSELACFVGPQYLVTVRKSGGFDMQHVVDMWDHNADLAKHGVGYLLHGLLDHVVDGHFSAVQALDEELDELEDLVFDSRFTRDVQRRAFGARKAVVTLRRLALPMREVVNSVFRLNDLRLTDETLNPYWQDVYDHVLRVTDWTDSLRDLVTSLLDTNLTIQGNRLNEIMKKLTAYAAFVAVPTAVTGFFGMNVPYWGFGHESGFVASIVVMVSLATFLYVLFKRNDWL